MELRLIILTVACFSCLVPPAFSTGILAAKALATAGAIKGAAVLGAGALAAKGALIAKGVLLAKGAAAIAAKGAVLKGAAHLANGVVANGAALLAAKGAALRGAVTLAAKGSALGGALLAAKAPPVVKIHKPLIIRPQFAPVVYTAPHVPTLSDKLASLTTLWGTVQSSIEKKTSAVGNLLDALKEKVEKPKPVPAVIYDVFPYRCGTGNPTTVISKVMKNSTTVVYYQRRPVVYDVPVLEPIVDC